MVAVMACRLDFEWQPVSRKGTGTQAGQETEMELVARHGVG